MLAEGEFIGGKYRVVRRLGEGGAGTVYEAENTWTTRRVAIKVLHTEDDDDPREFERFRTEAVAATKLSHPNIVDVFDMGEDIETGALFLVQEYLVGRDLRAHLDEVGRVSPAEALEVLVPIVATLVAAHARGVLHRDLKPENLFLARGPGGEVTPKLIDFGIALLHTEGSPTRLTRTGAVMGTVYYMSPEQARGDATLDARTDVWSIATVLFEMLAGAPPFDAPTYNLLVHRILTETPPRIETVAPDVPRALADVIARALTPDLAARTPDMRALLDALLEYPYLAGDMVDEGLRARHRGVLARAAIPLGEPREAPTPARPRDALARTKAASRLATTTPQEWDRPSGSRGRNAASRSRSLRLGAVGLALAVVIPVAVLSLRGAPSPSRRPVTPATFASAGPPRSVPTAPARPAAATPSSAVSAVAPTLVDGGVARRAVSAGRPTRNRVRNERPSRASAPSPDATPAPAAQGARPDLLVPLDEPTP